MNVLLVLILLTLWAVICAGCFGLGFYIGKRCKPQTPPRAAPEPTEEQKRNAEKRKIETNNMLTFNGDEQPDI